MPYVKTIKHHAGLSVFKENGWKALCEELYISYAGYWDVYAIFMWSGHRLVVITTQNPEVDVHVNSKGERCYAAGWVSVVGAEESVAHFKQAFEDISKPKRGN